MKLKTIALVAPLILAGCVTTPHVVEIQGEQCPVKENWILTGEEPGTFEGESFGNCEYSWIPENSSTVYHFSGIGYKGEFYDGRHYGGIAHVISTHKMQIAMNERQAEIKAADERRAAMTDEDKKREKAERLKPENVEVCQGFVNDLEVKTNFKKGKITLAKPMITGAFVCVVQGVNETPHGDKFVQLEITGNPSNGSYQYK